MNSLHISDETLLLLMDGELPDHQAAAAMEHLEECAACRQRRDAFTGLLAEVTVLEPQVAPPNTVRESLAQRMAVTAEARRPAWLHPRLLMKIAAVLLLGVGALAYRHFYTLPQNAMVSYEETGPEPNHSITPGSVRNAELSELCIMPDDNLDPVVTAEKKRAVFAAYGLDDRASRAYQVDYLINPQLGGNDEFQNLWPEPYHATVWNAQAKDALETRLHGMVCSGQMGLEEAQREIATDWIGAYKKTFHADRPVRVQAAIDSASTDVK
ncbi:anti-sigma factor family protein [Terriglobus sp. ADX1]|uniref:anti-sigma factor family protein n=1 Tax=Terriglobus sp. ADX1 TaxID=2794063 RepID=UPI002FE6346A